MKITVTQFAVGGFDDNFAYTVSTDSEVFIIDPSGTLEAIYTYISNNELSVAGVILTHTHHDHFDALAQVLDHYGEMPIYVHERGLDLVGDYATLAPLNDYDEMTLSGIPFRILHTPGHSDDSVCLYVLAEHSESSTPLLISGDTLFVGGCGRTSAHRVKDLYESLQELKALPAETIVYPGHNYGTTPTSTIERELRENRFYQCANFNDFKTLRLG